MSQFSINRQEFMTSDPGMEGIEYQREGGFFLSHKKLAIVITTIFLLLVAAGFIGAYLGAMPRKKVFDTTALIAEDVGAEPADAAKYSLSNFLYPSKYYIQLKPIVEDTVSHINGNVVIHFLYNDTETLSKIILNAKNINISDINLISDVNKQDFQFNSGIKGDIQEKQNNLNETHLINDNENTTTEKGVIVQDSDKFDNNSKSDEINISSYKIDEKHGILNIKLESGINPGFYILTINYVSKVDNQTLLFANFTDKNNERWLMSTKLKPINARQLFPSFDDVKLKSRFTLSITCSKNVTALTNTPLKSTKQINDNWVEQNFEETPLLSPHSLALIEGHINELGRTKINDSLIPIKFWGEFGENLKPSYLKEVIETVIKNFEDLFTLKFPMKKLDVVSVPFFDNAGSPGLISIKQNLFNVTSTSAGVTKYNTLQTLTRLIGRQWMGGLVNTKNWTDVWILESSLIDLQHIIVKKIEPSFNHSTFLLDVQLVAFEADGYSVSQSLQSKVNPAYLDAFHPHELYDKGACILRMLHGVLNSSNASTKGYKNFVSRWAYGNGDVNSFLEAMTNDSDSKFDGINIIQAMQSWIDAHGYPVVHVERDYETGTAKIHQSRFTFDNRSLENEKLWYIPLTWVNNEKNWSSPFSTWLKPEDNNIILDNVGESGEKSWVIFNVNSTGYFRVNYDETNWKLIAKALQENPTVFPSSVKASLIDNVLSLAFVGLTSYATVFNVINYLRNETQPEPWSALMQHALKLDLVLYDSSSYPDYQEFMRKLTSSLFSQVGLQIEKGTRMTLIAHQLASTFEDPDYADWARTNYENLKTSITWEERHIVPSYLRKTLLCTFAKLEDQLGWQWWEEKLRNITRRDADRNSFLSSLACFQVPWILQAVLNEIVKGELFDESDSLTILKEFKKHPVSTQVAFKFVQKNWDDISVLFNNSYPILRAFIASVGSGFTSDKDLLDFRNFRDTNYEKLKPVGYITALVESKGLSWLSFLNNSLSNFEMTINRLNDNKDLNLKK